MTKIRKFAALLLALAACLCLVTVTAAADDAPAIKIDINAASGQPCLWWDPVPGAVRYEIWRAVGRDGTFCRMWTQTGTTYRNTTAKPGVSYYYQVRAIGTDGSAGEFSVIKNMVCDLPRPTGFRVELEALTGKPLLSWEAVPGATGYQVTRDVGYGEFTFLTTTATSCADAGASSGYRITYRVHAILEGNQYATGAGCAQTVIVPPGMPGNVQHYNDPVTGLPRLTWDPARNAYHYEIFRATSPDGTYYKMWTQRSPSYTNTTAKPGVTYYYKVRASVPDHYYAASPLTEAVRVTCKLPTPVITDAGRNADGLPCLRWDAVDGAAGYEVYRASGLAGEDAVYTRMSTQSTTTYTNLVAVPGADYTYRVRAIFPGNAEANSAFTAPVYVPCP